MADVIAGGREPRSTGPRRWVGLLVVLAVAAGGAYAVTHRSGSRARAARPARATIEAAPAGVRGGLYFGVATATGGAGLDRVDLRTGRRRRVGGLAPPGGLVVNGLFRVRGGLLLSSPTTAYVVAGTRVARRLTLPFHQAIAPAASNSAFWLQVTDEVRRYGLDGRPQTGWLRLPRGSSLVRGTVSGLLLTTSEDYPEVWDPRTGRSGTRYAGLYVDATSSQVIWSPQPQPDCCQLRITNLATGVSWEPGSGQKAVSPDGRWLAGYEQGADPDLVRLTVLDLRSGVVTRVPGRIGTANAQPSFDFTADSRWLVLSTSTTAVWRIGSHSRPTPILPTGYANFIVN